VEKGFSIPEDLKERVEKLGRCEISRFVIIDKDSYFLGQRAGLYLE
jgi:hypothetical protein